MKKGLGGLKTKWHKGTLADIKRLGLPEPDSKYGFSEKLLTKHLHPTELDVLNNWMSGQTCVSDDKLGIVYYTHDVIRGIDFIRHGKGTYFD